MNPKLQIVIAAASTLAAAPAPHRATVPSVAPAVNVNGSPVSFTAASPIEVKGAVLVPLRGVFEAMGAAVDYEPATRTITAKKGGRTVILKLDSPTAIVDGYSEPLGRSAQVLNGVAYIPLRFVATALGGYVEWVKADNTIDITTPGPSLARLPDVAGTEPVVGQLTGVYTQTDPEEITLRVNGVDRKIPFDGGVSVLTSGPGAPASAISPNLLSIGGQVAVARDGRGYATTITESQGELRGTVKSIVRQPDGGHLVTLNDGNTARLAPNARLSMNGRDIQVADIKPEDRVLILLDQATGRGYELMLNPEPPAAPGSETGLGVPQAAGPLVTAFEAVGPSVLRGGDVLTVSMTATTGGKAEFSIPGVAYSIDIPEVSAGVYRLAYVIPNGVAVQHGTVLGRLTVLNHPSPIVTARQSITIDAMTPQIGDLFPTDGSTVDGPLPLIRAALSDPGAVGIAASRCKVELDGRSLTPDADITSTYMALTPSSPLAAGRHRVKVVAVDAAGNESTREWTFSVASRPGISSFTTNVAPGAILSAGQAIDFTVDGPAGQTATVLILGVVRGVPLHEARPGVYRGQYVVKAGDNAAEAPVVAELLTSKRTAWFGVLPGGLNISAGPPASPIILKPMPNSAADGNVTFTGTAVPLSRVRLTAKFETRTAAGAVAVGGFAGTREALVDSAGDWSIGPMPLDGGSLLGSHVGTKYSIGVETEEPTGRRSAEATINVGDDQAFAHRAARGTAHDSRSPL